MAKLAIVTFNSGELSPELDTRSDIEKYTGGCRRLENMISDVFGNATRRPGTELVIAGNGAACYYEAPTADEAKVQITTPQELQDMDNDLDGDYELMNNLDMSGFDWTPVGDVGGGGSEFTGTFDGNFFTISNLTKTTTNNQLGLFGQANGATLENVFLENFELHGDFEIGCLAGETISCTITLCGATGNIFLDQTAFGGGRAGGLIGESTEAFLGDTIIQKCWANVDITGDYSGFADSQLGGLIGKCSGQTVNDCWAGGSYILQDPGNPSFRPWAANAGGLMGDASAIEDTFPLRCHSYGKIITSGSQALDVNNRIGGFMGRYPLLNDPTDAHWDTTTSTLTWGVQGANTTGLDGHVTSASQTQSTYENFDFDTVWIMDPVTKYPVLRWFTEKTVIKQNCARV